jgi:hypothetical protein
LRELVVSRCNTSEIREPLEAARDDVAVFISLLGTADFLFAVGFAFDDGLDAALKSKHG